MDYKQQVAAALSSAIDGALSTEDVYNKIERPKDSKMGDFAFPAFALAKVLKKRHHNKSQRNYLKRLTNHNLKKLNRLAHTLTSSWTRPFSVQIFCIKF